MKIDITNLTIKKAHESLKRGDFTAVELTRSYLNEIAAKNKEVHAYLEVFNDALEAAKKADETMGEARSKNKDFPLLCGIPFAIKDNILIKGKTASSASKILEHYKATYYATAALRLAQRRRSISGPH